MTADSPTLEEVNALRIAAGLAPIGGDLAEGEEPPVDEDEAAEANYAQRRDEMRRAKEEADIRERIGKLVVSPPIKRKLLSLL